MKYLSAKMCGLVKDIPQEQLDSIREHIEKAFPNGIQPNHTYGQIQEVLLEYRLPDGKRMLLNHLAPIFLALCWGEPIE